MVKLGWGSEGDGPLRAQIEEVRFNTRGLMQPNWKSTQTSVEACKKLQFLKENHEESAGAWGFPVQADQGERRSAFSKELNQAEVGLAASKWEHVPLIKLLKEISPILEKEPKKKKKKTITLWVGMDIKGLALVSVSYIWYMQERTLGYKRACFSKLELHLKYAGKNIGKEAGRGNSLHEALYYTDT